VQQLDPATLKIDKTFKLNQGRPLAIQATDRGYVFLNSGLGQWTDVFLLNANRDYKDEPVQVLPSARVYQLSSIQLSLDQTRLYTSCVNLSPANITSYAVGERPALFRAQQCGSIRIGANHGVRGRMDVSRDGRFMFCDRGLTLWLEEG